LPKGTSTNDTSRRAGMMSMRVALAGYSIRGVALWMCDQGKPIPSW